MGKLKRLALLIRSKFPSKLPVGSKEFDTFCNSVIEIYNLPDLPSYRHAIATMILHLSPQTSHAAKSYFAKSIRKAMANQIAYDKIQEYKKLEEEKKQEETLELQKASGDLV